VLAAAAGIHRLAVPTPFAVGRVNCYLIEDQPLTLVDTGPNSGKSLDELEQALAALGHRIEDLGLRSCPAARARRSRRSICWRRTWPISGPT